jgi:hypothetical protein
MGCDIHFFVEKKSKRLKRQEMLNEVVGDTEQLQMEWESADSWIPNNYKDDDDTRVKVINRSERFYSGRNYTLFGILAGVRWMPKCGPISNPKGFPSDTSNETADEYESWAGDCHSASYLTLKELKDTDWSKYMNEYSECKKDLEKFMETIDKMEKLDSDPENVRCVFWFDN